MPNNKKWWVLLGTGIAAIMIAIDFTIVNTSLANIQRDLKASVGQLQWIMAAFGLFFSALLVAMGRFGDIFGRRKILYTGIIGFGLASLGAGLAPSIQFLIVMRALQGFFGAAVFPCGMAITADAFPEDERGRALGIYGSILGIGLAFGPVIGSAIVTWLGWRWIFFVNIPVIIISLAICFAVIRGSKLLKKTQVDWWGATLVVFFLGSLVFAINEGGFYGWASPAIIFAFIISFFSLLILMLVESRVNAPLIPTHLFFNGGFFLGLIVYCTSVSLAWPVIFLMPLYLHNVLGYNTGYVGLILLAMTAMTAIFPTVSGYVYDKKSKRLIIHSMFLLSVVSLLLFTFFRVDGPLWLVIISFILFGIAWGIGNGIAIPIGFSNLENTDDAGFVAGALTTALNVFAVFMLTLDSTLFRYKEHLAVNTDLKNSGLSLSQTTIQQIRTMLSDTSEAMHFLKMFSAGVANKITAIFHAGFVSGLHVAMFLLLAVTILFWLVAIALIKKIQLK